MSRSINVVLLCEGKLDEVFLRTFFRGIESRKTKRNHVYRNIRTVPAPSGTQSGEQFVRDNVAKEARAARGAPVPTTLVVHSDADTLSVQRRKNSIEQCIKPPREPGDSICILIPRRSTETWIRFLSGEETDEEDEVRKAKRPKSDEFMLKAKDAALTLANLILDRTDFPDHPPPSLSLAREELERIRR